MSRQGTPWQSTGNVMQALLYPVENERAALRRQGLKPKDHAKENRRIIQDLEKRARDSKEQTNPQQYQFKMERFKAVESQVRQQMVEGVKHGQIPERPPTAPATYIRKGDGLRRRSMTPGAEGDRARTSSKPRVPTREECLVQEQMLHRQETDYVRKNALDAIRGSNNMPLKPQEPNTPEGSKHGSYGKVPSYLLKRKEEMVTKKEAEIFRLAEHPADCPDGMRLMKEEERKMVLRKLDGSRIKLLKDLASLPFVTDTPNLQAQKAFIEDKLAEVDKAIALYSRPRVFVNTGSLGLMGGARLNTVDIPAPEGSEERPPVVLLHGFGAGLGIWARQLKDLAEDCRVIAVDLPGMGGSEREPFCGETEIEAEEYFLEAIEAWRKDLGLQQMVLVGHSLGGYLAATYALKYPQFIAHLVLVSPQGLTSIDGVQDPAATPTMSVMWSRGITPQRLCRWGGRLLGPKVTQGFVDTRFEGETAVWRKSMARYLFCAWAPASDVELAVTRLLPLTGHPTHPLQERLRKLKVGVVFVYGHYDWSDHRPADELIPRLSVTGSVAIIASAGHYPFIDNAPKFNALLHRLLVVTRARDEGFQVGLHSLEPTPPGSGNVSTRSAASSSRLGHAPAPGPPASGHEAAEALASSGTIGGVTVSEPEQLEVQVASASARPAREPLVPLPVPCEGEGELYLL